VGGLASWAEKGGGWGGAEDGVGRRMGWCGGWGGAEDGVGR
jgi:hypothetical protein